MGQIQVDFARVRSLLTVDPSRVSTADASASADALILDLSAPTVGKSARAAQLANLTGFVAKMRPRAYRPILLIRLAPLEARRAEDDLDAMMPARPDGFVLTGCPDASAVQHLGIKLAVREAGLGLPDGGTAIVAEAGSGARGMLGLASFREASARLAAFTWDAATLAQDCGAASGAYAEEDGPGAVVRTLLTLGAAAAGVPAYDTVSTTQGEAFARECAFARRLGLAGKLARDAGQVAVINTVFSRPVSTPAGDALSARSRR